jgi:hypothetical protein
LKDNHPNDFEREEESGNGEDVNAIGIMKSPVVVNYPKQPLSPLNVMHPLDLGYQSFSPKRLSLGQDNVTLNEEPSLEGYSEFDKTRTRRMSPQYIFDLNLQKIAPPTLPSNMHMSPKQEPVPHKKSSFEKQTQARNQTTLP